MKLMIANMGDPIVFELETSMDGKVFPVRGSEVRISCKLFEDPKVAGSYEVEQLSAEEEKQFRGWFPESACEDLKGYTKTPTNDREWLHNVYRRLYENCIGV